MSSRSTAIITAAAASALAVVLWKVSAARRRQRQLRRGEIRPLASYRTTVDGCRMYARWANGAAGRNAVPVVLVHGFGISSSYFVPAAERLAAEFTVYVPDLPGHGQSDTPPEPLDIPRLADALVGWMDAIGLGRASLVANSMGCQVVVDAAVRYPDRIDRLVLIGPAADPAARTVSQLAGRLLADVDHEHPSLMALVLADYVRMGRRLLPEFRFLLEDRIEDKLPHVVAPVLLVRGENDPIAPQGWLDAASQLLRSAPVVVIPGWGHAVHYSAAPELVVAIAPFLRGCGSMRIEDRIPWGRPVSPTRMTGATVDCWPRREQSLADPRQIPPVRGQRAQPG